MTSDLLEENADLRKQVADWKDIKDKSEVIGKLTKAKEIIKVIFYVGEIKNNDEQN